jgi:4-hydroxy-tetrahydrodipicolinate reductase
MRIALIGHGTMGRLVETVAVQRGHVVTAVLGREAADIADRLREADAVIDFSEASAVIGNVKACMHAGVPLVEGTTGWSHAGGEVEKMVSDASGTLVYGANFSLGVNLFYRIAAFAAELISGFPEYERFIEEQHHSRKKDAPSGTALKLKDILESKGGGDISVASTRAGRIPGTHRVGFDGPTDQIVLEHTARSREGFAAGAVMAAEWIVGKKGFYEFTDVVDDVLRTAGIGGPG